MPRELLRSVMLRVKRPTLQKTLWKAMDSPGQELRGVGLPTPSSYVYEVTQESTARTVWSMQVQGTYLHRASRMGSLYPGCSGSLLRVEEKARGG
jgi:hypothetical protein